MKLVDYLDKGASLGAEHPCLTMNGQSMSYGQVQRFSYRVARALAASGVGPGDRVAILSSNNATSFACVFGISRTGAVWCPVNPRNEAHENSQLLDLFGVDLLLYQAAYQPLTEAILTELPALTAVCLDDGGLEEWLAGHEETPWERAAPDDVVMMAGTGGTTGLPKGVPLTGTNLQTMTSITLMSYPCGDRPVYMAVAPLTHAAGVMTFPILLKGGEVVIMPAPDVGAIFDLTSTHQVTHTFLPPTIIYLLLDHPDFDAERLSSLQCLWYGAAPMSATRLAEAVTRIGPVMAQIYGQTEAPMMIATMSPADHLRADGTPATERFAAAGRPAPLVPVRIVDEQGMEVARGVPGEIVVKGPLVMPGYFRNPEATAEATTADGWHRTGDIGVLTEDNWLSIVDRAKDMIITGGYNVYSTEVEQVLMEIEAVRDCAVVGLPDEKWGERIVAVLELHPETSIDADDVSAYVKSRIGSVKSPKQVEVWDELPRSKVGKIMKAEVKARIADA